MLKVLHLAMYMYLSIRSILIGTYNGLTLCMYIRPVDVITVERYTDNLFQLTRHRVVQLGCEKVRTDL